jgi:multidrug efflux pump subunit AcrA (membrane-fusion protein)
MPLIVLAVALVLAIRFVKTKPMPKKQKQHSVASVVETVSVSAGQHKVVIEAQGSVTPVEEVNLQPEVTGLVVWKNSNLIPGGIVHKGDVLLRIDARNYETARNQQLAVYEKSKVEYQVELSRSEIAAEEWRMMGEVGGRRSEVGDRESGAGGRDADAVARAKSLALREPQLHAATIAVLAASNLLAKATLDLERTEIKAPFDAVVIDEFVDRGQLVSPQSRIAHLAGTKAFRIKASLPQRDMLWLNLPDNDGKGGPSAKVLYDIGSGDPIRFAGRLTRVLGNLDNATRMATVLVRVDDPLRLKEEGVAKGGREGSSNVRLPIGAYVEVHIAGHYLKDVVELPGALIREGDRVWIMNADSCLEIRDVDVIRRQGGRAFVKTVFSDGTRIVSSHIATPVPGMKLRGKSEVGDRRKGRSGGKRPNGRRPETEDQETGGRVDDI